jgi:hypothetical protein
MSFAMFAAPFNDNSESSDNNLINKKKQTHNKTQKTYSKENFDTKKVNSVLEKIHNDSKTEDEDNLGDFNPPPMPQSSGVSRTLNTTENMVNMSNEQNNLMFRTLGRAPQPNSEDNTDLDLNNYNNNYGDSKSAEEYYKNILPNYLQNRSHANKPYYNINYNNSASVNSSQDVLLQKINYMINLLEEQQDERTNNVTEEVVLYSFLGIFIIFIVDSFSKVGKYVR